VLDEELAVTLLLGPMLFSHIFGPRIDRQWLASGAVDSFWRLMPARNIWYKHQQSDFSASLPLSCHTQWSALNDPGATGQVRFFPCDGLSGWQIPPRFFLQENRQPCRMDTSSFHGGKNSRKKRPGARPRRIFPFLRTDNLEV